MINLTTIFQSVERLVYDLLLWVLLVPKTLIKIVLNPDWVPGYITTELGDKTDARFDDYFSPMILVALATLAPYTFTYVNPPPSVFIHGAEQASLNEPVDFYATADFIHDLGNFRYEWTGEDNPGQVWEHDQLTDYVTFKWNKSGWKKIEVTAANEKKESLYAYHYVYILAPGESSLPPGTETGNYSQPGKSQDVDVLKVLQGPGILQVLQYFGLPLLFALAIDVRRGKALTRTSLMRSFFIQCYYFSPFFLAVWIYSIGAAYYVTPAEPGLLEFIAYVMLFMCLWLVYNETKLIACERGISKLWAFLIVVLCLTLIWYAVMGGYDIASDHERFRIFLGRSYVGVVAGLLIAWIVRIFIRLFKPKGTAKPS